MIRPNYLNESQHIIIDISSQYKNHLKSEMFECIKKTHISRLL